jgi:hypothetical protein
VREVRSQREVVRGFEWRMVGGCRCRCRCDCVVDEGKAG